MNGDPDECQVCTHPQRAHEAALLGCLRYGCSCPHYKPPQGAPKPLPSPRLWSGRCSYCGSPVGMLHDEDCPRVNLDVVDLTHEEVQPGDPTAEVMWDAIGDPPDMVILRWHGTIHGQRIVTLINVTPAVLHDRALMQEVRDAVVYAMHRFYTSEHTSLKPAREKNVLNIENGTIYRTQEQIEAAKARGEKVEPISESTADEFEKLAPEDRLNRYERRRLQFANRVKR